MTTKNAPKSLITKRLRTDLERSKQVYIYTGCILTMCKLSFTYMQLRSHAQKYTRLQIIHICIIYIPCVNQRMWTGLKVIYIIIEFIKLYIDIRIRQAALCKSGSALRSEWGTNNRMGRRSLYYRLWGGLDEAHQITLITLLEWNALGKYNKEKVPFANFRLVVFILLKENEHNDNYVTSMLAFTLLIVRKRLKKGQTQVK